MKYHILSDKTSINGLQLTFDPIDAVTTSFFRSLKLEQFPFYISELIEQRNFGTENASFIFFDQMDWEDKAEFYNYFEREINDDEIRIRIYDGSVNFSALKGKEFFRIFCDYSEELLKKYRSNNDISEIWKNEMMSLNKKLLSIINN